MPPGQCACSERNFSLWRCTDGSAVPGLSALGPLPIFLLRMLYGTGSGIAFVQAACGFEPTDSICAALRLRYPCIPCGRNAVHVRRIRTAGKRKALFSRLRARRTGPQHRRAFGSVCPDAVSAPGHFAVRQWECCIWQGGRNLYKLKNSLAREFVKLTIRIE